MIKRKISKMCLAAVLALALAAANLCLPGSGVREVLAETEASEDFVIDDNGVLTKYTGAGGSVVIPDGVTGIGCYAF